MNILLYSLLALVAINVIFSGVLMSMKDPSASIGVFVLAMAIFVVYHNLRASVLGIVPTFRLDWWLAPVFLLGAVPGLVRLGKIIRSYFVFNEGNRRGLPYEVIRRRIMQILEQGQN